VTDRGDGRVVLEIRVGEDRALGEQPLEPAGEFAAEPGEIVVPELVHRDEENEPDFRECRPRAGSLRGGGER
jgi:hypothetical protein